MVWISISLHDDACPLTERPHSRDEAAARRQKDHDLVGHAGSKLIVRDSLPKATTLNHPYCLLTDLPVRRRQTRVVIVASPGHLFGADGQVDQS
jgi:hypothetical protein